MNTSVNDPTIRQAFEDIRKAFKTNATKSVSLRGQQIQIPYPFPSPADWRDTWIYFLMIDRFNNPGSTPDSLSSAPPVAWNQRYGYRQGGTFKGIEAQLDYLQNLGVGALWITPVLKNAVPPQWEYNYHGYGIQDFLTIDGRFGSDGTSTTAEQELIELVDAAHARNIYVIVDIVLNHTARVFDYLINGTVTGDFTSESIMEAPLGSEPDIEWINGLGSPRTDWTDHLPNSQSLSPDDAVWPSDLQRADFFRRRGNRLSDASPGPGEFIKGDFDTMRQLVMEYQALGPDQEALRSQYGQFPVLDILILSYWFLVAKFDLDGFRLDTVKYVDPDKVEQFGNAVREFALSIGKRNFFTFGEVYDDEQTIEDFIGRNSTDGFGIDAALDFPLFYVLPGFAKCQAAVEQVQGIFTNRKIAEQGRLSSHGEAGKYFVTFLDNHDQNQRFNQLSTPAQQVLLGITLLFCLQGIPCLYYGTEQGLQGTLDAAGHPDLSAPESVREALWGKQPVAFDQDNSFYQEIKKIASLRAKESPLQYGRIYFRELSSSSANFGYSSGVGGVLAFSRILASREILIIANSSTTQAFEGLVVVDMDINRSLPRMMVAYSNLGTQSQSQIQLVQNASFYNNNLKTSQAETAALRVALAPMEVQVLVPVPSKTA